MTFRNLNQTWRGIIYTQYDTDHAADAPFPIRYLIKASPWNKDIIITIPQKVEPVRFRLAIRDFYRAMRRGEPVWAAEVISVKPRKRYVDRDVVRESAESESKSAESQVVSDRMETV